MDNKMIQTPNQHVHEYVDLGLPSGTLWATENIKDTNGNELYFAWGETIGYTADQVQQGTKGFSWDEYKFGSHPALTKYNRTDRLTVLEPEDDAATQNWGAGWRMPTADQFSELLEGTDQDLVDVNGIKGLLCTSKKNGNILFLPAVGGVCDGRISRIGDHGNYWAASLDDMNIYAAQDVHISNRYHYTFHDCRYIGYSVRPVRG